MTKEDIPELLGKIKRSDQIKKLLHEESPDTWSINFQGYLKEQLAIIRAKNKDQAARLEDVINLKLHGKTLQNHYHFRKDVTKPLNNNDKISLSLNEKNKNTLLFLIEEPLPRIIDHKPYQETIDAWKQWERDEKKKIKKSGGIKRKNPNSQKGHKGERLQGVWHVYIRREEGLKRTFMEIKGSNGQLSADFKSIKGFDVNGPVSYNSDAGTLLFDLWNKDYQIVLRGVLDFEISDRNEKIVTGINSVISNSQTLGLPFILHKPTQEVHSSLADTPSPQPLDQLKTTKLSEVEKNIIQYLMTQIPYRGDRLFGTGKNSLKENLKTRLESLGRGKFEHLEEAFSGRKWVSLSRAHELSDDMLSVYHWEFEFDSFYQKCTAFRSNHDGVLKHYVGEVKIIKDRIEFELLGGEDKKLKRLFGNINVNNKEVTHLLLFASSNDSSFLAREILIPEEKASFENEGESNSGIHQISHEQFLNKVDLDTELKMYLNYRRHSVLSFTKADLGQRYVKQRLAAEKYAGDYLLYLNNIYGKEAGKLTRFTLKIDTLAHAEMRKKYNPETQEVGYQHPPEGYEYVGYAEAQDKSLLCYLVDDTSDSDSKRQDACILFHIPKSNERIRNPRVLVGLILDTNVKDDPDAAVCLAIRHDSGNEVKEIKEIDRIENIVPKIEPADILRADERESVKTYLRTYYTNQFQENFREELESIDQLFDKASELNGLLILRGHSRK